MIEKRPVVPAKPGDVVSVCDFARQFECARQPEMLAIERRVTGCDYGGTSWTTRAEADRIASLLDLAPGVRLLEIGAGSGWPGLYLAASSGCEVVLTDLPRSALMMAAERAVADGVAHRTATVVADGGALPFADANAERLSHSDVLCCLANKAAVLAECRRVARADAVMVFSVIAPAPELAGSARLEALAVGPPFVDTPADYALLLRDTGWRLDERLDVTADYVNSNRVWRAEFQARAGRLVELLGEQDYADRLRRREAVITALEKGLLKREMFAATATADQH